jgi:hypothetical protein
MEKQVVKAEEVISYECNCPNCDETIYSEYQKDWDIHEMVYCAQEITCGNCGCEFIVAL